VLVRVDFNVPLKDGRVCRRYAHSRFIATIRYLLERGLPRYIDVASGAA
jgi:3-phosphoglycerate kinase